jgi:hypothetical protein
MIIFSVHHRQPIVKAPWIDRSRAGKIQNTYLNHSWSLLFRVHKLYSWTSSSATANITRHKAVHNHTTPMPNKSNLSWLRGLFHTFVLQWFRAPPLSSPHIRVFFSWFRGRICVRFHAGVLRSNRCPWRCSATGLPTRIVQAGSLSAPQASTGGIARRSDRTSDWSRSFQPMLPASSIIFWALA